MDLNFASFGDPVDPAYERFKKGAVACVEDATDAHRYRWRPVDGAWYYYTQANWSLDPTGLPITKSPTKETYDHFPRKSYEIDSFQLPNTFKALHAAWIAMPSRHASAVWALISGQWFLPSQIGAPIPIPGGNKNLPPDALARIARVEAFRDAGKITRDYAQTLINQIVAEYT